MRLRDQGFVYFTMLIMTSVIALFSLMILAGEREGLALLRASLDTEAVNKQAIDFVMSLLNSSTELETHCTLSPRSTFEITNATSAWWAASTCRDEREDATIYYFYDPPFISSKTAIRTGDNMVYTKYQRVSVRYASANGRVVIWQAMMAQPSMERVEQAKGVEVGSLGIQELERLV